MKLFLMNCMERSEQTMEVKITFDDGKVGLVHEVMEIKKEDDDVHIRFQKGLMICYELYIKSIEIIEI